MFAPNIIGNNHAKLALLLSTIGAPETPNKEGKVSRGRIHCLLIGPPGLAKTQLGREVKQLRINSRYASGKRTTGKSLTAMVVRENENEVLRLGPAAHARGANLFINEFDKLPPEDQDNLLEVMEEGTIDMTTFAKEFHIPAATTIIASANPVNNNWIPFSEANLIDQIPFSQIVLNRFDIIVPFRNTSSRKEDLEYADAKTSYDERRIKHNYNFLRKLIELTKTIDPTITEHAKVLLNNFYVEIKQQENFASNPRTLESIYRIAKAFARRNLSPIVDEEIATLIMNFMNVMLVDFHSQIHIVPDPFMQSYNETIKVIQHIKGSTDLREALKTACDRNEQVNGYIGRPLDQNRNRRFRNLCHKILENKQIVRVSEHPTVVYWKSESDEETVTQVIPGDLGDVGDSKNRRPTPKIIKEVSSDIVSDISITSDITRDKSTEDTSKNPHITSDTKNISDLPYQKTASPRSPRSPSITSITKYEDYVEEQKEKFDKVVKSNQNQNQSQSPILRHGMCIDAVLILTCFIVIIVNILVINGVGYNHSHTAEQMKKKRKSQNMNPISVERRLISSRDRTRNKVYPESLQ